MEENNELKDLVLDDKEDSSNSRKMRKLLIIIATLVILFLIILFIMKIINSSDNTAQSDARVVIPPEIETLKKPEPNDEIFQQVPILQDENSSQKQSFEDIVKNLKEKEELRQAAINNQESTTEQIQPKKEEVAKKEEIKKESASQPKTKQTVKKEPVIIAKTEAKKENKPIKQSVSINNKNSNKAINSGAYIQVASLVNVNQNNELFKKLKSNGYDYKIYETTINGKKINKILVGTYDNAKINSVLADIRSKINPNAFIFKVK